MKSGLKIQKHQNLHYYQVKRLNPHQHTLLSYNLESLSILVMRSDHHGHQKLLQLQNFVTPTPILPSLTPTEAAAPVLKLPPPEPGFEEVCRAILVSEKDNVPEAYKKSYGTVHGEYFLITHRDTGAQEIVEEIPQSLAPMSTVCGTIPIH